MKIHWLEFENLTAGQKIERIEFGALNLLVGASGAGKTQILKVLSQYIEAAASGHAIPFAGRFAMSFSTDIKADDASSQFVWEIDTASPKNYSPAAGFAGEYVISKESLRQGDKFLIKRNGNELFIGKKKTPGISPDKSVLNVFTEPSFIALAKFNFAKAVSYSSQKMGFGAIPTQGVKAFDTVLKALLEMNLSDDDVKFYLTNNFTLLKIYAMKNFFPKLYASFLEDLQSIFPMIDDVGVDIAKNGETYEIFISQDKKIIPEEEISGGMMKTIYIIANTAFSADGSVILLDEIENALGFNCLEAVTDYIIDKATENRQQFILTSHHPYIINNIPIQNWRIVSQNHGTITAKRAENVGIDTKRNRQETFFQLMQYYDAAARQQR